MNHAAASVAGARLVAEIGDGRGQAWVNTALRTKSAAVRDAMALDITQGALGEQQLSEHLASLPRSDTASPMHKPQTAATLATIWAASHLGDVYARAAHRLFRSVLHGSPPVLRREQQQIYAQLCFVLGEDEDVREALDLLPDIPKDVTETLLTDLINPSRAGRHTSGDWQVRLSAPFVREGLTPIHVDFDAQTPFDGLSAAPTSVVDGPLVTVIIPCYRPDASLFTSIRSISSQSYQHLEVLLMDDGSGPDYESLFEEASTLDERVRLVHLDENKGTYSARNSALRLARGQFITVQDSDDWSHPERIASQVKVLLGTPHAAGSFSDAIRATDSLLHQWIGYSPRRRNASSLMFRREDVQRIGPFDTVRKSGDSEFYERLTRLVGPTVDTKTPLAITRLRAGTLSRSDFSFQWMDPSRLLYRAAYRSWHRALPRGSDQGVDIGAVTRPFPAPKAMLRGLPGGDRALEFDVVTILDGSDPKAVRETIELTSASSLRIAALHMEDSTRGRVRRPEIDEVLLQAHRRGDLDLVVPGEVRAAAIVIVMTTGPIELPHTPEPEMLVDHAVVVARPPSSLRSIQDLSVVAETSYRLFGKRPRWAAATAEDRDIWSADGWDLPLASELVRTLHTRAGGSESTTIVCG